jgi:hypothetical protein
MSKIKVLSVALLAALSTYAYADTLIVKDPGVGLFTFTCATQSQYNIYVGGGWSVTDRAGGDVHWTLVAE